MIGSIGSNNDQPMESESDDLNILNSTSSSIRPSQSASQVGWDMFKIPFHEKREIQRTTIKHIREEYPALIFQENDEYIKSTLSTKDQFGVWWWQTTIGQSVKTKSSTKIKDPLWAKKAVPGKQADTWEEFIQLASTVEGLPRIACKRCNKILDHPTALSNSSTSNMKKHLKTSECSLRKRLNPSSQSELSLARVSHLW